MTAGGDRGAVTAEAAVVFPVIVVMLMVVLTTGAAGVARLTTIDAANAGARLAAQGVSDTEVGAKVRELAGPNASTRVVVEGSWVTVIVNRPVASGWASGLPLNTSASATCVVET